MSLEVKMFGVTAAEIRSNEDTTPLKFSKEWQSYGEQLFNQILLKHLI